MTPIAIIAGQGSGQVVAESIRRLRAGGAPVELLGYLNDELPRGSTQLGAAVLGPVSAWRELPAEVRFIAPLHKVKQMPRRARLIRSLQISPERWAQVIDPGAAVATAVEIGGGVHIDGCASLQPAVAIGDHVAVRAGAVIGHHVKVGDFCFIGANATVAGYARLEEGVHIGVNACVREQVRLGRYAVVGMGSVVLHDVPAGVVVAGNPARAISAIEI